MILAALVLDSPHAWPLALGGAAVLILSVVLLYLPQVGALAQPWRWLLPALRCGGMVALAVSILKPVAVRPASQSEAGAILLLVDRSMSMSVRDLASLALPADASGAPIPPRHAWYRWPMQWACFPARCARPRWSHCKPICSARAACWRICRVPRRNWISPASPAGTSTPQKVAFRRLGTVPLCRAAGCRSQRRFPASVRAAEAAALLLRMARGSDERIPQAASSAISSLLAWSDDAQAAADLALYQSDPSVRDVCNKLAAMSRFARVEMALTSPSTGLLGKLPSDVPLFGYALADDIQPLPLRGGGQPVRRLLAQPDGCAAI